jgi:ubiquinone/menaquinone biosynthesis C-methylase UbiE
MRRGPANPWLAIPEADYVGHMSHPSVNQRSVLNRLMREVLEDGRPRAFLVLGCSSGNGLEHVDRAVTEHVTVIDINPSYLHRLADAFPNSGFQLEIRCADVNDTALEENTFDLVHAALVFEYVTWQPLIRRVARTLTRGGTLSVVLQRSSTSSPAVTPTPFTSLQSLESLFHFVDPDALSEAATDEGLTLALRHTEPLPSGKAFEVLRFIR